MKLPIVMVGPTEIGKCPFYSYLILNINLIYRNKRKQTVYVSYRNWLRIIQVISKADQDIWQKIWHIIWKRIDECT